MDVQPNVRYMFPVPALTSTLTNTFVMTTCALMCLQQVQLGMLTRL